MVIFLLVMLLLTFLQGTIIPLNVILVVILARSFVVTDKENYWIAFSFGLLLALLLGYSLGSLSLVYLMIVTVIYLIKRANFASHWLAVLPLSIVILAFFHLMEGLLIKSVLQWNYLMIESLLILPAYLLIGFWEERFVPKSDIRLKIGK